MLDKIRQLRRRTFLKATGAAVLGSAVSSSGTAQETENVSERTRQDDDVANLIAHRGFAGLYPENTVGAVEAASTGEADPTADRVRADMIEIDIMPSADGDVMVFHDDTLERLTGATGEMADQLVWETSTEQLQNMNVLGTNETIPTLQQVMDAIPSEVGVNIEFKNPGSEDVRFAEKLNESDLQTQKELWMDITENTFEVVADYDNEILVSSFQEGALAAVREVTSDVPVAFLFWDSIQEGMDITERYDAEALHPPRNMIQGTPFFGNEYYEGQEPGTFEDIDILAEAHDAGREVNVWTLKTWRQAKLLQEADADGLIADYDGLQRFPTKDAGM